MTKGLAGRTAAAALIAGAMLVAAPVAAQQKVQLSYHWGPTHPAAGFANQFAERVTERSDGALDVQVFPSGQLFGIRDVLGGVASGAVQVGMAVGIVSFPPINSDYNVTAMPGMFDSFEQMRGFFDETEAGQALMQDMQSKTGIRIVGRNPVGPIAVFSAKDDLSSVDSLAGISARVLTDADRVRWGALDAGSTVSLPTGEVYTALQNGIADTVSTVPGALSAYSWWDCVKSVQLPYFQFADAYIIVNAAWFEGLSPELQQVVTEVGAEITAESTAAIMDASAQMLDRLEAEQGGTVFELTGDELAKMNRIEREQIYPGLTEMVSKDTLDAAQAYTQGD